MMTEINNLMDYSWWKKHAGIILCTFVVVFFYVFMIFTSVNIPFNDDYDSFFRVLHIFNERGDWTLMYKQHNEHRILWFRLLLVLNHYLSGSVNIVPYIMLGNLGLLGIAWILYRSFRTNENTKLLYFLPLIFLLFVPVAKMHNFGMPTFVNITVIFFAYLSLYFLHKDGIKSLIAAMLAAIVATFSTGAGMFTFPAGIVLLIFPKIRWKRLFVWLMTAGVGIGLYFMDYRSKSKKHGLLTDNILEHGDQMLLYPFAFVGGSLMGLLESDLSMLLMGMLIAFVALWMLFKKWQYFKANPLLITYLVFLGLLMAASAANRGYRGYDSALATRYQLMHVLTLGSIYLYALEAFPKIKKRIIYVMIGLSALLYVVRMADNIPEIINHKNQLESSLLAYYAGNVEDINSFPIKGYEVAVQMFDLAISEGTYKPPTHVIPKTDIADKDRMETSHQAVASIKIYKDTPTGLTIHGNAYIEGYEKRAAGQRIYLALTSGQTTYLMPANKLRHHVPRTLDLLRKEEKIRKSGDDKIISPPNSDFSLILPKTYVDLPKGTYQLSLLIEQNKRIKAIKNINKKIII